MSLSLSDLISAYHEKSPPRPAPAVPEGQPSNKKAKPKGRNNKHREDLGAPKSRKRKRPEKRKKEDPKEEEEEVELDMEDLFQQQEQDEYWDRTCGMEHDEFYHNYDDTLQALLQQQAPQQQAIIPSQIDQQKQQALIDKALYPVRKSKDKKKQTSRTTTLAGVDDQTDVKYSDSASGRYQPRRKRVKINVPTMSGSQEKHYRMETAQEVEQRVARLEADNERNRQVQMWKLRTMTFQEEEDIGNVFAKRADKYLANELRQEKRERLKNRAKAKRRKDKEKRQRELDEAKERERIDALEEDDSVREQSQLLAQLSQSNVISMSQPDDEERANECVGVVSATKQQDLDYWQKGFTVPRPEDIGFKYNPSLKELMDHASADVSSSDDEKRDSNERKEVKATFAQLERAKTLNFSERFYFPPNRSVIANASGFHRTGYKLTNGLQFLAMASRALCGTSRENTNLENRYLRLLATCTHGAMNREEELTLAHFQTSHFIRIMSEEQGQNMYLYVRHSWNDASNAARRLGLLDSHEETAVTDSSLTTIHLNWKGARAWTVKRFKKSPKDWSCESALDQDTETGRGSAEDDSLSKNSSVVPDGATSGETSGGIFDVVTKISAASAATLDRKLIARLSFEARGALAGAVCLYSHVPGTIPPVPQFPLDPTAIIFGPADKYANFYHSSVRMDQATQKIILSTLMARVAGARLSRDRSSVARAEKEISKFIAESAVVNKNDFYKRFNQQFGLPEHDIPLVEFNRGMSQFCNFTANACASQNVKLFELEESDALEKKLIDSDDEDEDDIVIDSLYSSMMLYDSGMKDVAERIWGFLQLHINHNGLLRFPKLRVTAAIAHICRSLPASAAEILSRPLDEGGDCTPIQLFKQTLEHMEEKKMITDTVEHDEDAVRAAEIEYIMHDASEMFQDAVKIDPTNVDYHLWHIGCLSACLLISSGNKVSSESHLFPSLKTDTIGYFQGPRHEVRVRLRKFSEVRYEVSTAVKTLLTLARYQSSARTHFAVVSVMGWSQMMGLLAGGPMEDFLEDIQSLYAFHVRQWIKQDTSLLSKSQWKNEKHTEDDAFVCARNIEDEPEDMEHWKNLVRCLGPVSGKKSVSNDENWWGTDRDWWEDSILSIALPPKNILKSEKGSAAAVLDRVLNDDAENLCSPKNPLDMTSGDPCCFNDRWLDWLPTKTDTDIQDMELEDFSDEVRSIDHFNELPRMIQNDQGAAPLIDGRSGWLPRDYLPEVISNSKELNAYKILILCHLLGAKHPKVEEYVYHAFVLQCFENIRRKRMKRDCDELRLLRWLVSMGLDLRMILHEKLAAKRIQLYTIVDDEDIKELEMDQLDAADNSEADEPEIASTEPPEPPQTLSPSANNARRTRQSRPGNMQRSSLTSSEKDLDFWSSLKVPPVSATACRIDTGNMGSVDARSTNDINERRQRTASPLQQTDNEARQPRRSTNNDERRQHSSSQPTVNDSRRERLPAFASAENDARRERRPSASVADTSLQQLQGSAAIRKRPHNRVSSQGIPPRKRPATNSLYDVLRTHGRQTHVNKSAKLKLLNAKLKETIDLTEEV
jgi:hypothetical protein